MHIPGAESKYVDEENKMPKKRKADELAGPGSFADKLRIRRVSMEGDDASGKPKAQPKPKKDPNVEAIRKKREERKREMLKRKKSQKKDRKKKVTRKRDLMMRGQ